MDTLSFIQCVECKKLFACVKAAQLHVPAHRPDLPEFVVVTLDPRDHPDLPREGPKNER